jgi:predicted MFS family arabinose efflux permease
MTKTTPATSLAVISMAVCAAMLVASEFMPLAVLTPMAAGLGATEGQTGQANALSGVFALLSSLAITTLGGRLDRKFVLIGVSFSLAISAAFLALATSLWGVVLGRVFMGLAVGGFWSLSTATIMRLVEPARVPAALTVMYMGQAVAAAFGAPLGAWFADVIGWRWVFWALVPLAGALALLQVAVLPRMAGREGQTFAALWALLRRPYVARGLAAAMGTWAASATMFTYLRPYLEGAMGAGAGQVTLMLTLLGLAGFVGTWAGGLLVARHGARLLAGPALVMAGVTFGLIFAAHSALLMGALLMVWGAVNTGMSVIWMTWLAQNIDDQPELAGSLMVPALQTAIMGGGMLGGALLDGFGISATFGASVAIGLIAALLAGTGRALVKG